MAAGTPQRVILMPKLSQPKSRCFSEGAEAPGGCHAVEAEIIIPQNRAAKRHEAALAASAPQCAVLMVKNSQPKSCCFSKGAKAPGGCHAAEAEIIIPQNRAAKRHEAALAASAPQCAVLMVKKFSAEKPLLFGRGEDTRRLPRRRS